MSTLQGIISECYEILYEMEDKRLDFHANREYKKMLSIVKSEARYV